MLQDDAARGLIVHTHIHITYTYMDANTQTMRGWKSMGEKAKLKTRYKQQHNNKSASLYFYSRTADSQCRAVIIQTNTEAGEILNLSIIQNNSKASNH